jgi:putative flippase GtrA
MPGARVTRFLMAGGLVACVNLGTGAILLALGFPVQAAVGIAYGAAICVHFTLQRTFVFAGEGAFALTLNQQLRRYAAMAAVQYPTTAGLAALFVAAGLPDLAAVVATALLVTPLTYFILRTRMFHLAAGDEPPHDAPRNNPPQHRVASNVEGR